jgi:hypothetical protein
MKLYNQTGNREEPPVRLADDLLDEPTRSTEGASLEIRRSQAKLSGKRTLFLKISGKFLCKKISQGTPTVKALRLWALICPATNMRDYSTLRSE